MNHDAFLQVKGTLPQRRVSSDCDMSSEELLMKSRVTPTTELPPMENLFCMYDVPCFYRGELVAICGKAKSGKTLFLSTLMASGLAQRVAGMDALRRATEDRALRVLWIDTEQSQQSTQDILVHRILPMAQLSPPCEGLEEVFYAFNLRGMGFEKRRELVELAVSIVKPDLAIIDGIKDLVTDINDAVQATVLMEQLMAMAQRSNCCLACVLHQNKSAEDHNMRGSIGTELTNKAFEVYQCSSFAEDDVFKVQQALSRRHRIQRKLYYQLDEKTGLPTECTDFKGREQPRDAQGRWVSTNADQTLPVDLQKLFTMAMEGRRQRPYNEVMAIALKKCGVPDAKTYYIYVSEAEEQGIIRKMTHPDTEATWVELLDNQLPF